MRKWKKFSLKHSYLPIREDDCSYVWNVPAAERCEWVKKTKDCRTDSVVQFTEILFCTFGTENMFLFFCGMFLIILWLLYLFLILGTTADNFFCPSLAVIAAILRLSESIAGVTILAFGNGAPDIFTSLVSDSDTGIIMFTELLGAGVFVTSIIAGSVAVVSPFYVNLKPLIRDVSFYILAVAWISYVVKDSIVKLWEAISFILVYVSFIVTVVLMQVHESKTERLQSRIPNVADPDVLRTYLVNKDDKTIPKIPVRPRPFGLRSKLDQAIAAELGVNVFSADAAQRQLDDEETDRPSGPFAEFFYDVNPIDKEEWDEANNIIKFVLIIRAPVMFLLQLFIPVVNLTAVKNGWSRLLNSFQLCVTPTLALFLLNVWRTYIGVVPLPVVFLAAGTVIGVFVFLVTDTNRIPRFHNVFAFVGFLAAMLTVYLVAGEVMAVLQCIGYACSISDAMLGMTLLAWGNSVGDLIANVAIARQGFPRMGLAACFGGPMFNTLLGMGLTYGIAAASEDGLQTKMRMSDMAPGCIAFLLCSLILTLVYFNVTGAIARRSYGFFLYSLYLTFFIIQILSEAHFMHPLGIDHRPD